MEYFDSTFGVGKQALAVLTYLSGFTPDFAEYDNGFYKVTIQTKPWYNGREQGVVVSMTKSFNGWIHIAFFEHRNSDSICALKWETEQEYFNHPLEDPNIFEKSYSGGTKSVKVGEIGKMADWIYKSLKEYYFKSK